MNKLSGIRPVASGLVIATTILAGCAGPVDTAESVAKAQSEAEKRSLTSVLSQVHQCNASIEIRSQALTPVQTEKACKVLVNQEKRFHDVFNTHGKPVADDYNDVMRANVYHHRDEFVKYATDHFTMPTNNGGMYLEGYPDKENNHAEFVAYERDGEIWNLRHEFVHYLDGRFNKYGDYCNGLHDDHAGPEFCPSPNLGYPHVVWWAEGVGEYIARGADNPKAVALAANKSYPLSELFNTSSNENTGGDRVYRWGYLAVRFMMENQRQEVDKMLTELRQGDWGAYQELVRSWDTKFDGQFESWLETL